MYERPVLQRYGTFRELTTQIGFSDKACGSTDGLGFRGPSIACAS